MALTLTSSIGPTDRTIAITGTVPDSIEAGYEFRIDDERLVLTTFGLHEVYYAAFRQMEADRNSWVVERGVAVSHDAGAEILGAVDAFVSAETETPPTPFASTAGGGGVSVDNGSTTAEVTTLVAPGAVIAGDTATLGKWTLVGASGEFLDASVAVTATGSGKARADRTATGTSFADAYANTVVVGNGDAEANVTVTANGVQDALAKTIVIANDGEADISHSAEVTTEGTNSASAYGNWTVHSAAGEAQAQTTASSGTDTEGEGDASAYTDVATFNGAAEAGSFAAARGDGDASVYGEASVVGEGTALVTLTATRGANVAGLTAAADSESARIGFFGKSPVPRPTGVAVTDVAIHAALVDLGLITA